MEILTKPIKYRWFNRLFNTDRQQIVSYYLEGYAINYIAETYCVSCSSVKYHLKQAGVFIPNTQPSLKSKAQPIKRVVIQTKSLSDFLPTPDTQYDYDESGERYLKPKSYATILRESKARSIKQYENNRKHRKEALLLLQPKGKYLVKVSLSDSPSSSVVTSNSTRSW